jgi:uncharacterized protein
METDHFEWDDEKAADVLRRQGVSFSNASRVFDDGRCLHLADRDRPQERTKSVGSVDGRLLTVISMDGRDGRIRIITVWPSTTGETDDYYSQD